MPTPRFVAGDWGTSQLRLNLCADDGAAIDSKDGPGVAKLGGRVAEAFSKAVSDWDAQYGALPTVLCGMAGSTLGWREVPYLTCPIHPERIVDGVLRFEAEGRPLAIAPGLSCRNRLLGPDVMRGEETQILGALRRDPGLAEGRHFLCMPGTHAKWVVLRDGVIESFLTSLAGELFDVLGRNSVLVGPDAFTGTIAQGTFARALEQSRLHPDAELIHLLFQTRSRQLAGEFNPRDAAGFLSGLVIGQDVAGAVRLFREDLTDAMHVTIIGAPQISELYALALEARGIASQRIDGALASLAGLEALQAALFRDGLAHAS
jgi:2-dehydro-3-deoxygalactonokinase